MQLHAEPSATLLQVEIHRTSCFGDLTLTVFTFQGDLPVEWKKQMIYVLECFVTFILIAPLCGTDGT